MAVSIACDCVHDFAAPHATLSEIRALLNPAGVLFVVEPKAADVVGLCLNPTYIVHVAKPGGMLV